MGPAWLALTLALIVHVADETVHDFIDFYNPIAHVIRARLRYFPPEFTFGWWLAGLITLFDILLLLTPLAYRTESGAPWLRKLAYVYAVVTILNGCIHLTGATILHRAVPGVYSAPVLVVTGSYLLLTLLETRRRSHAEQ